MSLDKQKLRILSLLAVLAGFHFVGVGVRAPRDQQHESVPVIRGYEGGPNGQSTGPDGERNDVSTGGK